MSLLPLGILASSGGVSASYELIQTAYGTGSSNTITFSSIPQTYKHLQIRFAARDTGNTSNPRKMDMLYNGQSSTYRSHYLGGNYANTVTSESIGAGYVSWIPGLNGATNSYGVGIIDLLDYTSTTKNATWRTLSGYTNGGYADNYPNGINMIALSSGMRTTTTAITSLSFVSYDAFTSQTRFSLYGIKG